MEHRFLNWVKSYDIKYNGLTHNFFIASHKDGSYNGVLAYILENKDRTDPATQPAFKLQTEYFPDLTEAEVYRKGMDRVNELFKDNYEIAEGKTNWDIK